MASKKGRAAFSAAFKTVTKNAWNEARDTEVEKTLNVPDGAYVATLLSVKSGLDKNKKPYVMIKGVIRSDDEAHDKQVFTKGHFITPPKPLTAKQKAEGYQPRGVKEKLESLSKDLQRLGIETSGREFDECLEEAEELAKTKPLMRIRVSNPDDDQIKRGFTEPTVWLNGLVEEGSDDIPEAAHEEYDTGEEEEEEGEEAEGDEGEEEETEESEETETEEETEPEEEEEEKPKPKPKAGSGGKKPKAKEPEDDEPPEDYEEEEVEEEEEKAPPKKPSTKKPATADKPVVAKGKKVGFSPISGKPPVSCTITAVNKDGSVNLTRDSDHRIFKSVQTKDLSALK